MKNKSNRPPKTAERILKSLMPGYLASSALGDYAEIFLRKSDREGVWKAWLWYWVQVLKAIPKSIFWGVVMFKSYLKIAVRNMLRHKAFSFINIAGLAIGMACAMLIFLWVQDELSYDRFHKDVEDIYRVVREVRQPDHVQHTLFTSWELCRAIQAEFPEIETAAAINGRPRALFTHGDNAFLEYGMIQADISFFQTLPFPFLAGDPNTALLEGNAIVITEEIAEKYFGDKNPLGQTLNWNNWMDLKVTGVIRNIPRNSHLIFNMVINTEGMRNTWPEGLQWENKIFWSYVKLRKTVDPEEFGRKISRVIDQKYPGHSQFEDRIYLQPLAKTHLYNVGGGGAIKYVYIFSLIALFVLFIACINYMNLATARSAGRAKEVGLRKVFGSGRKQLTSQFFSESLFFVFSSYLLSLILTRIFLPVFNQLAGKQMIMDFSDITFILGSIAIVFFTGIIAGSYPALRLSAFAAIQVLKGHTNSGLKGAAFRRVLVVTQFTLSIGLIICTAIVHQQLDFLRNQELGFEKENIVYIPMKENSGRNYQAIKTRLLQNPNIISVTAKDRVPTRTFDMGLIDWEGKDPQQKLEVELPWVDFDYFKTLNMEILYGRDFSQNFSADIRESVIVNEMAAKRMGLESPLGKRITFSSGQAGSIIGVVKNAHFRSRQYEVVANVYRLIPNFNNDELSLFGVILIKLKSGNIQAGISAIEDMWKDINPEYPFECFFLNEDVDAFYRSEMKMSTLSDYFSILAVLISCLGLFGLASFMVDRRTKEIGVRRVLGASAGKIVRLLSRESVIWIIVANLIAWPAAYFAMRIWLQNYVYRIAISWWVFLLSGMLALVVGFLTVGYHAYKSARINPVNSLRHE